MAQCVWECDRRAMGAVRVEGAGELGWCRRAMGAVRGAERCVCGVCRRAIARSACASVSESDGSQCVWECAGERWAQCVWEQCVPESDGRSACARVPESD